MSENWLERQILLTQRAIVEYEKKNLNYSFECTFSRLIVSKLTPDNKTLQILAEM